MMSTRQTNGIVLQCPDCGARAGLNTGKKQCSQGGHSPMVPAWTATGVLLTPTERQKHGV